MPDSFGHVRIAIYSRLRNLYKYFPVAVILLLVPLFFLNIRDSHDWGDDFAQYILQAKNFAEGKPQTAGAYIFNPDYPFYAPPVYPVGYPLLLAPVYSVFGNNLLAFNYFQTLLLLLFGAALFFFLRMFMDNLPAMLLMLIAVYNPWMLDFKTQIIADLPFALCMLSCMIAYLRFREKGNWRSAIATGCCTGFALLIKPVAIILLIAYTADFFRERSQSGKLRKVALRQKILLLLSAALLYLIVTRVLIPSSVETTAHFHNLYDTPEKLNKRFNINAGYYILQFQELFRYTNPDWDFSTGIIKAFTLTLLLLGLFGKMFNRFGFLEVVMLLFLGLVLFFPNTTQGFRYLLPVLPLMLLYIFHGYESVQVGWFNRKAVFVIACLFGLFQYKTTLEKMWRQERLTVAGPQETAAQQAFDYIAKNTEPDAVIAFIKPRALALYAQRKSLSNHPQQEQGSMVNFFEKNNTRYYLLSRDVPNPALEKWVLETAPDLAWSNEKFFLYKRKN